MDNRSNAFTRQHRLLVKADFDRVFAKAAVRINSSPFLLLARPNAGDHCRLGIVVGKRHAKRAVDRNRIRRRIRETFRVARFPAALDVIVLARAGAGGCEDAELTASLDQLWSRFAAKIQSNVPSAQSGARPCS